MKILFFGDIVGRPGRNAIKQILPEWKEKYRPDLIIANGENMAHGKGITDKSLQEIIKAGVDAVTSGDHIWDQKEAKTLLENPQKPVIRPANFPPGVPGKDHWITEVGTKKILIFNLLGRVFMKNQYDDPFRAAKAMIEEHQDEVDIIIVDWHSEATAEKKALGWYLDGEVSAVLGTHTHVPTADERILPQGTAYISDVGMVGVRDSSLGMKKEIAINRFLTQMHQKLEVAEGEVEVDAVLIDIENQGKAKKIKRLNQVID